MKTIHHVINIMFTGAEVFTMRCSISQVFQAQDIIYITVIINVILATKRIFNMFLHLYQLYFIIISSDLRNFLLKNFSNTISFWDYSSDDKWLLHLLVNKELKFYKISLILPNKTLWNFSKKKECDSIVKK